MLKSIKLGTPGFGLRFDVQIQNAKVDLEGLGRARITCTTTEGFLIATSLRISENGEVIQSSEITSTSESIASLKYTMGFRISVNRASYGQLTEGGPIPIPKSENRIELCDNGRGFVIANSHLGAHLHGCLENNGKLVEFGGDIQDRVFVDSPVTGESSGLLELSPKTATTLTAKFTLQPKTGRLVGSRLKMLEPLRFAPSLTSVPRMQTMYCWVLSC